MKASCDQYREEEIAKQRIFGRQHFPNRNTVLFSDILHVVKHIKKKEETDKLVEYVR